MVFEAAHERFGKLPFAALFGPAARHQSRLHQGRR